MNVMSNHTVSRELLKAHDARNLRARVNKNILWFLKQFRLRHASQGDIYFLRAAFIDKLAIIFSKYL